MSLSRLAVRLAAYEALNPYASIQTGPWPTIAGANVYDSRITPLAGMDSWDAFLSEIDGKPVVTVYTEETEVEPIPGATYPAEVEMADLVVEMMIAAKGEIEVRNNDGSVDRFGEIVATATSREHEALLDLLEAQVRNALDPQGYTPSSALFQKVARELHHVHSVPQRDAEKVVRYAARTLRLKLRIGLTVWPAQLVTPPALPGPLGVIAGLLDPNSTGGRLCARLLGLILPASAPVPLTDLRIFGNLDRGVTPSQADDDFTADVPLSG